MIALLGRYCNAKSNIQGSTLRSRVNSEVILLRPSINTANAVKTKEITAAEFLCRISYTCIHFNHACLHKHTHTHTHTHTYTQTHTHTHTHTHKHTYTQTHTHKHTHTYTPVTECSHWASLYSSETRCPMKTVTRTSCGSCRQECIHSIHVITHK